MEVSQKNEMMTRQPSEGVLDRDLVQWRLRGGGGGGRGEVVFDVCKISI